MDFGYIKSLDNTARERYLTKLKIVGINECHYNLPADIWQNNPTKWPEVQWPDVFHYLIDTPGWVQTLLHIKNTSNGRCATIIQTVLFKIEAAVRNRYTKLACTDKPCSWNQCFTKAKESVKEKLRCSKRKRKPPPPAPSLEKQKQFLQKLAGLKEKPVVLSVFKEKPTCSMKRGRKNDSLPLSLKFLHKEENSKKSGT
ncbi:hypothetical protein MAR_001776 [Mya arenaria]|uniref:Uncharacterized protein n=1 Tax=Mya arenaria TaxID=6604 RepID=A0ABY7FCS2_MYAAR|nr:hypothetical protein MAR_001776 [Mya arenaria]